MKCWLALIAAIALLPGVSYAQANLLSNGNFEQWSGGVPVAWSVVGITVEQVVGDGGGSAVRLGPNEEIGQVVTVAGPGTFTLTLRFRSLDGTGSLRIDLGENEGGCSANGQTTWQSCTLNIASAGGNVYIPIFPLFTSASYDVDNVVATFQPAPTPTPAPPTATPAPATPTATLAPTATPVPFPPTPTPGDDLTIQSGQTYEQWMYTLTREIMRIVFTGGTSGLVLPVIILFFIFWFLTWAWRTARGERVEKLIDDFQRETDFQRRWQNRRNSDDDQAENQPPRRRF